MGNRRFSMTTYVIVGVALGALYFVGKLVNPPPPAPPKEVTPVASTAPAHPATPAPPSAEQRQKEAAMQAEKQARMERMQKIAKEAKAKPAPKANAFNPTAIQTDADYWQHYKDGKKGTEEIEKKVADALAKQPPRQTAPVPSPPTALAPTK